VTVTVHAPTAMDAQREPLLGLDAAVTPSSGFRRCSRSRFLTTETKKKEKKKTKK